MNFHYNASYFPPAPFVDITIISMAEMLRFVMHAPRQTGKTTTMLALAKELTASGKFIVVMLSMQVGGAFRNELGKAENAILDGWRDACRYQLPAELQPPSWPVTAEGRRIGAALSEWAQVAPRPLVIFLDEIDSLSRPTLYSWPFCSGSLTVAGRLTANMPSARGAWICL